MDTWESRMAQRAAQRRFTLLPYEPEPSESPKRPDTLHFEGKCDVCHESISMTWNWADGIIDYGYDDNNRMFTWMRHYAIAPRGVNPDCAVYSSRVYRVSQTA